MNAFTLAKAWDLMTTEQRVEAIRPFWINGYSASFIYKAVGAPTRNVIIGYVHRHIKDGRRLYPSRGPRPNQPRKPRARKFTRIPIPPPRPRKRPHSPEAPTLTPPPARGSISLQHRSNGQCAYPYGEPSATMLVCGEPVKQDRPYCPAHCRIAYVPVKSDGKLRNNHFGLVGR